MVVLIYLNQRFMRALSVKQSGMTYRVTRDVSNTRNGIRFEAAPYRIGSALENCGLCLV
ncbi:hypothetical protein ABIE65_000398 [Constrictibacter sp. MBR-5]|jgi:hypothetical protein|uniref:hypothetical protein n=1 Tax=Constrictibacter sp. MBR-5 TaxID=3156467 RepID=UPI003391E1CF